MVTTRSKDRVESSPPASVNKRRRFSSSEPHDNIVVEVPVSEINSVKGQDEPSRETEVALQVDEDDEDAQPEVISSRDAAQQASRVPNRSLRLRGNKRRKTTDALASEVAAEANGTMITSDAAVAQSAHQSVPASTLNTTDETTTLPDGPLESAEVQSTGPQNSAEEEDTSPPAQVLEEETPDVCIVNATNNNSTSTTTTASEHNTGLTGTGLTQIIAQCGIGETYLTPQATAASATTPATDRPLAVLVEAPQLPPIEEKPLPLRQNPSHTIEAQELRSQVEPARPLSMVVEEQSTEGSQPLVNDISTPRLVALPAATTAEEFVAVEGQASTITASAETHGPGTPMTETSGTITSVWKTRETGLSETIDPLPFRTKDVHNPRLRAHPISRTAVQQYEILAQKPKSTSLQRYRDGLLNRHPRTKIWGPPGFRKTKFVGT